MIQKGFTLVELMVVMAIIAILSTAGISQYGKFIKGARDSARLADIESIETIILSELSATGQVPSVSEINHVIRENAGKEIADPMNGKAACVAYANNNTVIMKAQCYYQYSTCDDGTGYIIYANLEDSGNLMKYATAQESIGGQKIYAKGNCTTLGDTNLIGPDSWY